MVLASSAPDGARRSVLRLLIAHFEGVRLVHVLLHRSSCYPFPLLLVDSLLDPFTCRHHMHVLHSSLRSPPVSVAVFLCSYGLAVSSPLLSCVFGSPPSAPSDLRTPPGFLLLSLLG